MSDELVLAGSGGTITIAGDVLERLVRRAAEEVDGVTVQKRGTSVSPERVALGVTVRYGDVLPAVAETVQERVAAALRAACELRPVVDVTVEELA